MPNTDNQKYISELGRCLQRVGKIIGHLPHSTALLTVIAAMTLDFAVSHSDEAAIDFNRHFAKLARKYPLHVTRPADMDRETYNRRAERLRQAWRDLRPPVHTRAVQITQYSTACLMVQYLHGDRARAAFEKACLDWAAHWTDHFQPDTGVKDASFNDPIPDDVKDAVMEKPPKLVDPHNEGPLSSHVADAGLRGEETN